MPIGVVKDRKGSSHQSMTAQLFRCARRVRRDCLKERFKISHRCPCGTCHSHSFALGFYFVKRQTGLPLELQYCTFQHDRFGKIAGRGSALPSWSFSGLTAKS